MTSTNVAQTSTAAPDDATVVALLTSLFAGPTTRPADVTSARAAYQDALHGRAVLVDLRPAPARATDGGLGLPTVILNTSSPDALTTLRRMAEATPLILVSTDGTLASRIAAHLRVLGLTWVEAVDGGFAAWRGAGLPLAA